MWHNTVMSGLIGRLHLLSLFRRANAFRMKSLTLNGWDMILLSTTTTIGIRWIKSGRFYAWIHTAAHLPCPLAAIISRPTVELIAISSSNFVLKPSSSSGCCLPLKGEAKEWSNGEAKVVTVCPQSWVECVQWPHRQVNIIIWLGFSSPPRYPMKWNHPHKGDYKGGWIDMKRMVL